VCSDASGRGWQVVDALAARWGHVRKLDGREMLWAELAWSLAEEAPEPDGGAWRR
jgi:hypothetical protein